MTEQEIEEKEKAAIELRTVGRKAGATHQCISPDKRHIFFRVNYAYSVVQVEQMSVRDGEAGKWWRNYGYFSVPDHSLPI